jgi:DNA-binding transcriptional ArsR family regulator
MDTAFQALSSTTRRRILAFLSKSSLTAGEIADRFAMSKPAVSRHLSILESATLVQSEKKGLHVHYTLNKNNLFAKMNDFLVNFCPEGRPLKLESVRARKKKTAIQASTNTNCSAK